MAAEDGLQFEATIGNMVTIGEEDEAMLDPLTAFTPRLEEGRAVARTYLQA